MNYYSFCISTFKVDKIQKIVKKESNNEYIVLSCITYYCIKLSKKYSYDS